MRIRSSKLGQSIGASSALAGGRASSFSKGSSSGPVGIGSSAESVRFAWTLAAAILRDGMGGESGTILCLV